jgi:hypothetical protein
METTFKKCFIGFAGVLALMLALLARPKDSRADEPRHVVLYFTSTEAITVENTTPLVAYVDQDGRILDWMFDGMIVCNLYLLNFVREGIDYPREEDFNNYMNGLFEDGQLADLATAVAEAKIELGDPTYRLKLYLSTTTLDGTGANAIENTRAILDSYEALDLDDLELVGFYWNYEEDAQAADAPARISETAGFLDGLGYELVWIPYFTAARANDWQALGFDRAAIQPNFAFSDTWLERFHEVDVRIRQNGFSGMEFEFGQTRNPNLPPVDSDKTSAIYYLEAADQYNWAENAWNAYYWGTVISRYAGNPLRRDIYDRIYRVIAAHPRRSSASRLVVPAAADTFVETAEGFRDINFGDEIYLNAGTNAYPNALHAYLLFDLDGTDAIERILSAHLFMNLRSFPYGSSIEDGQLYFIPSPSWDESTLTGSNEPGPGSMSLAGPHRLTDCNACPARYAMDIFEEATAALDSGLPAVSFMLRRETEDAEDAQAAFDARENGTGFPSSIEIVYIPAPPTEEEEPEGMSESMPEILEEPAEETEHAADVATDESYGDLDEERDNPDAEPKGGCQCRIP